MNGSISILMSKKDQLSDVLERLHLSDKQRFTYTVTPNSSNDGLSYLAELGPQLWTVLIKIKMFFGSFISKL